MPKILKICENCSKVYFTYKTKQRFCSSLCTKQFLIGKKHPSYQEKPIKNCIYCHTPFKQGYIGKRYIGKGSKFCTRECFKKWLSLNQQGKNNRNWKGGKYINSDGYVIIRIYKNGKSKCVQEHRYIMEQILERPLYPFELVHHINGIKHDNRIENLEIVTHSTHNGQIVCPYCLQIIKVK